MRLAWFSPWPPSSSGAAASSADAVPALAARGHAIDVFVDAARATVSRGSDGPPQAGAVRVLTAHDFVWRQARGHYDLPVYQAANSRAHDFIWPYLLRWPGLTVLRDARLHHARAGALVSRGLHAAYREVFAWNHPDRSRDLAELGVHGFPGAYFYLWPMRRDVMEASRLIASHGPGVVEKLRREHPGRPVTQIALGHGREDFDVSARRTRFRTTRGIPESAPVFGVFGRLTAERRVPQILRAFAAARLWAPDARLLLVGTLDPQLDVPADARALGVAEAVCLIAGAQGIAPGIAPGIAVGINDDEFDDAIAACDVAIAMQWPTALETLAPWLRALAARRATIILDLEHQRHVPALDPRIWRLHGPTSDFESGAEAKAITVAIDILDEEHSLRLAMRRLGTDAALRERLGTAGRAYWESAHTLARMTDDYERAINEALAQPLPSPNLPPSLRWDGTTRARALLEPFDLPLPF